jgi:hypothetical protein
VLGWLGDKLKVGVSAPPEKGKANKAVEQLLAKQLGIPKRDVSIVAGQTSSSKIIEIRHLDMAQVMQRLPGKN